MKKWQLVVGTTVALLSFAGLVGVKPSEANASEMVKYNYSQSFPTRTYKVKSSAVFYSSTSLKHKTHYGYNYPNTVFESSSKEKINKKGKSGYYYYLKNNSGSVKGWVYSKSLKAYTPKPASSTTSSKPTKSTNSGTTNTQPTTSSSSQSTSSSSSNQPTLTITGTPGAPTNTATVTYTDGNGVTHTISATYNGQPANSPSSSSQPTSSSSTSEKFDENTVDSDMLQMVNTQRQNAGAQPLTVDNNLFSKVASIRVQQIQSNFSHYNADGSIAAEDLANAAGLSWNGENIAQDNIASTNYETAKSIFDNYFYNDAASNWGHKKNILYPSFTKIAIATVVDSDGQTWNVMDFSE